MKLSLTSALFAAIVFLSLGITSIARPQEPPAPPPEPAKPQTVEETKDEEVKEEEKKDEKEEKKKKEREEYENKIKDLKVASGLFTIYYDYDESTFFLELKPKQFENIYLLSMFREAGDGNFFDSGAMLGNFPIYFKRVGKKVQLIEKNVRYRAEDGTPIKSAVERGVSDSVFASSNISAGPHPDSGNILVDLSSLFIRDHARLGESFSMFGGVGGMSFDAGESYFSELKSFPKNTEIEVTAFYRAGGGLGGPDSFRHIYRYSLYTLPPPGYKPRLADDRVGYFLTMYQDYTDLTKENPYVRYINRWRLEKKFPFENPSPPKEPIVFWVENTVPEEYRDAVRAGILEWNKAFERIGFRDAIQVRQMPDDADWDPADIRYNVVQWIVNPGRGYAVGPSWADPYTGEIYAADIRIAADFVRSYAMTLEEYVNPLLKSLPKSWRELPTFDPSHEACEYGEGLMLESAFAFAVLSARGYVDFGTEEAKKFINDGIKDLVSHEVGHTLGLRHNFKASTIHSLADLQNRDLTQREGLSASVMDYNVVNVAPKGMQQGEFWQTMLGTYDYWAIEYGYKPIEAETPEDELTELEKIASRNKDPKLPYGTDGDAFFPIAVDPFVTRWDATDDPLYFSVARIELGEELLSSLEEAFETEGARFQKLRRVFGRAIGSYFTLVSVAPKFIGGMEHSFAHVGDPGAKTTFSPVSSAQQREALRLLKKHIFSSTSFRFSHELLNKLAPERFPSFDEFALELDRVDYPVHEVALSLQTSALYQLYNPILLERLVDFPLHYPSMEDAFTIDELFAELRSAIWSEVYQAGNIDSFRRNLQRVHLSILTDMVLYPYGIPEDAVTLARADLNDLSRAISVALANAELDRITRAHLEETLSRMRAVLTAQTSRDL